MNCRKTFIVVLLVCLAGCQTHLGSNAAVQNRLSVFAAASLTEVMSDLGDEFTAKNPGVEIIFNFAGSQQLAQQLAQGAPADVFASADQLQMDKVVEMGRINRGSASNFAFNKLVVIYPGENPAGLTQLKDLAIPGIKLVLAAKEVPAGNYSVQFLLNAGKTPNFGAGFPQRVLSNVVSYEENVRSVYSKVALGEADGGIVYSTDVPEGNPDRVGILEIPERLNIIAEYPIAVINDSTNVQLAQTFISFVLSFEGQKIFARYRFTPIR